MITGSRGQLGGWQSRTTFVLALSASAVGLGNLWRFSYLAGEHGGAPFVLAYVLCLFLVAVPVLIAEVLLGHHGRGSPPFALRWAADRSLASRGWMLVGWLSCLTALLLLAYYLVIAGWALAYAQKMGAGVFAAASASFVGGHFQGFLQQPLELLYWQSLFLAAAMACVLLGVRRGVGLAAWIIVPGLLGLLAVLVKFALDTGNLEAAQAFLFSTSLADFSAESAWVALGQAFFTLGVGVGVGISYGAYAPARLPIGRSVIAVALFDTVLSLMAGLAIFPIVFANNIEPAMGPGLIFVSLPYAFGNVAQGDLFGSLFFAMMVLAALGSAVAMLEVLTGYVVQRLGMPRWLCVVLLGAVLWVLGLGAMLSFNLWRDWHWLGGRNLFQLLEWITAAVLLPLVSLLTVIFVGWCMHRRILRREMSRESGLFFSLWRALLRYIVPPAILLLWVGALVAH